MLRTAHSRPSRESLFPMKEPAVVTKLAYARGFYTVPIPTIHNLFFRLFILGLVVVVRRLRLVGLAFASAFSTTSA